MKQNGNLTTSIQNKNQLRGETNRCINQGVNYRHFVASNILGVAFANANQNLVVTQYSKSANNKHTTPVYLEFYSY